MLQLEVFKESSVRARKRRDEVIDLAVITRILDTSDKEHESHSKLTVVHKRKNV